MVIKTMRINTEAAQQAIHNLARGFNDERTCDCDHALADALITQAGTVPSKTRGRLDLLINKYLK